MPLLVTVLHRDARADAVGPPPADCPAGSFGDSCHGGPFCRPSTCESDAACAGGEICQEVKVCVGGVQCGGGIETLDDPPIPTFVGRLVGGRIWRYELEPVDDGTLVRESWDITGESVFTKPAVRRAAGVTRKNMAATLDRIEELLASP